MIISRDLGLIDIHDCWIMMKQFTEERTTETPDQIWFVEHHPVYTLGLNSDRTHIINPVNIPVVELDRGGQVTYHGPGQLVMYTLFDVNRLEYSVRQFVELIENVVIEALSYCQLIANGDRRAPGVYVDENKIASLGIRVKKGRSYHGVAINHINDLAPFKDINPCGIKNMSVTSLKDLNIIVDRNILVGYLELALEKILNKDIRRHE
jgi:lipoyl(octanoyl) transferase